METGTHRVESSPKTKDIPDPLRGEPIDMVRQRIFKTVVAADSSRDTFAPVWPTQTSRQEINC